MSALFSLDETFLRFPERLDIVICRKRLFNVPIMNTALPVPTSLIKQCFLPLLYTVVILGRCCTAPKSRSL